MTVHLLGGLPMEKVLWNFYLPNREVDPNSKSLWNKVASMGTQTLPVRCICMSLQLGCEEYEKISWE